MKRKYQFYEPPTVEVIEVTMEQGFAASQPFEGYGDDTYDDYEFGERY